MIYHLIVTLLFLVAAHISGEKFNALLLVFFTGFLIDGDHVIAYWIYTHNLRLDLPTIYKWICQQRGKIDQNDLLLFFHENEVIAVVSVILLVLGQPFALAAYLVHNVADWLYWPLVLRLPGSSVHFLFNYLRRRRQLAAGLL